MKTSAGIVGCIVGLVLLVVTALPGIGASPASGNADSANAAGSTLGGVGGGQREPESGAADVDGPLGEEAGADGESAEVGSGQNDQVGAEATGTTGGAITAERKRDRRRRGPAAPPTPEPPATPTPPVTPEPPVTPDPPVAPEPPVIADPPVTAQPPATPEPGPTPEPPANPDPPVEPETPPAPVTAVEAPVRTNGSQPGTWFMTATVTNGSAAPATAELWQTIFQAGTDGERVRESQTLEPGESITFSVACGTTRATYGWWTTLGTERSSTTWTKCM